MTSTITGGAGLNCQNVESRLQVVHATPGRVRLCANDNNLKSAIQSLSQQLRQQDGVREVVMNQQTGSLVITFDENYLSLPQVLALIQKQMGVAELAATSEEKKTDLFAAWKSVDFWKQQGLDFIPLFTGLAVTGGLGISGLAALPIYMLAAEATRQAIDLVRGEGLIAQGDEEEKSEVVRGSAEVPPTPYPFHVVHTIPGRVRFHIPRFNQDRAYAKQVERLLKADAQVTRFRINQDAASLVINYKPDELPISHWVELLQSAGTEISAVTNQQSLPQLDNQLAAPLNSTPLIEAESQDSLPLESITVIQPPPPLEANGQWAVMKPPAIFLCLNFLANFPLDTVLA